MPSNKHIAVAFRVVTVLAAVAIVFAAVWIMARHMGLIEDLDFGAGAYYYADAPQLHDMATESADTYSTPVPRWVHIVLFLSWGWLMWRLWLWVDRKTTPKS